MYLFLMFSEVKLQLMRIVDRCDSGLLITLKIFLIFLKKNRMKNWNKDEKRLSKLNEISASKLNFLC